MTCEHCGKENVTTDYPCWNCGKVSSSSLQRHGSSAPSLNPTSPELAISELERARWAIERKDWLLARVYSNQALQWIKTSQREQEQEQ